MTAPFSIPFVKLNPAASLPRQGTDGAVGYDLCACCEEPLPIPPGQTVMVSTGLAMALPPGYGGFIFARSGLGVRHGIVPGNCVGVIDPDYRGEIMVGLHNHSDTAYTVAPGERIAQLVVLATAPFTPIETDSLEQSTRADGGFGSTGTK